ncbi:MAG: hypothetical protein HYX38_37575 [Rhodospirillales bacterium]|nr:hypothetical protein [Rhodospirillales bacterium]
MIRALIQPFGLKVGQVSLGKLEPTCGERIASLAHLEAILKPLLVARTTMWLRFIRL